MFFVTLLAENEMKATDKAITVVYFEEKRTDEGLVRVRKKEILQYCNY